MTTNELRAAAQRALRMALRDMEAIGCDVPESASLVGYFCNRLNEIALTATTNEAAAQAEGRGSDLRLLLIDLDMRLRECVMLGLSAAEAYDSAYQEAVTAALAAQPVQAHGEAVARIVQNSALQISMQTPDGGVFDMSRYVGATLYTHPAPAVDRGLSGAQEREAAFKKAYDDEPDRRDDRRWFDLGWQARALAASAPRQAEPKPTRDELLRTVEALRKDIADPDGDIQERVLKKLGMWPAPSQAGSCQASDDEPDCWAILTPNGSKLVSGAEAKGRAQAYPLYRRPQAPPAGRTLTDEEIDALIDKWTEGGEWFFHTSGHIMGDKPNRAEFRRLIRLAASSTTAGERE